jgi:two-component system, NarL family, invasion response regulator UvrY
MGALQILIADNNARIRETLRELLERREDVVVSETTVGPEAVDRVRDLNPQVIILDVSTTTLVADFDVARNIRQVSPNSALLIISIDSNRQLVRQAQSIGARGFIDKARAAETLSSAVDAISHDKTFFPDDR